MSKQNTYSKPTGFQNATLDKVEKVFRKVYFDTSCWKYLGSINKDGYGRFNFNNREILAHRAIYELFFAEIPSKIVVDHSCHNNSDCIGGRSCIHRRCVNPKHLVLASISANNRSGNSTKWQTFKTHCKHGHEFSKENTYLVKKEGKIKARQCIRCSRARKKGKIL